MTSWYEIGANRRILAYILFSMLALGIMFFWGILPVRQEIAELEKNRLHLESKIKEQEVLRPVYQSLQQRLQGKEYSSFLAALDFDDQDFDIESRPEMLTALAKAAGLQQASFAPRPDSLNREGQFLLIQGELQGQYQDFRNFLIQLSMDPNLRSLEQLRIQSTRSDPVYSLQIWVDIH